VLLHGLDTGEADPLLDEDAATLDADALDPVGIREERDDDEEGEEDWPPREVWLAIDGHVVSERSGVTDTT
jgi:hypothetical protein